MTKKPSKEYTVGHKKPPKHSQFKKGQIANPLGAGAHDPVKKAFKRMTLNGFKEIIDAAVNNNLKALENIAKDPNASALQVGVAVSLGKAAAAGDWNTLDRILERIVGKTIVRVDHTSDGAPMAAAVSKVVLHLPDNKKMKPQGG